jgi:hypothetical protein
VRRRCGRAVEDIRDLEQRQDMGETTTTSSTVLTVASSSGTAAATVGSTDMYAAIPTLPIAAALAAAGSETAELNGGTCGLLDRPDKKQVCLFYCSETEDLARRIAAETDSIELKSIRWGFAPLSKILLQPFFVCIELAVQNCTTESAMFPFSGLVPHASQSLLQNLAQVF